MSSKHKRIGWFRTISEAAQDAGTSGSMRIVRYGAEDAVSNPYGSFAPQQMFAIGTRVFVSGVCGGWRNNSEGVISSAPEPVQTTQGKDFFYWVQFDTPQHDLSDGGPYVKAKILSCCLSDVV
ncbi:MAG: hypothetical protein QM776_16985 [Rhodocyclaceae bacterium]